MSGSEGIVDGDGVQIINETAVASEDVMNALIGQHPEIAALTKWSGSMMRTRKNGSLFDRDKYITPFRIFDQMDTAREAARYDDIVSGIIDSTESLAFSKISIEAEDSEEEDIWNQIAENINLDARLREMWRELATVSQFYVFQWWGTKNFKMRGRTVDGRRRKKVVQGLRVPIGMTILDPKKIIPVGSGFFNLDKLVYIPENIDEVNLIDDVLNRKREDKLVSALIDGPFNPSEVELRRMKNEFDIRATKLYVCNPRNVWRHTLTKPQYQNFADVRMASIFELLDMKNQLREMDRSYLIGGTNFIILIKKGSDQLPAKPAEVQNLQANVRTLARVPVIVGDHRLSIEIITPKLDTTLQSDRYDMLDARIAVRLYQMFVSGNMSARDDSIKLGRVIARGLESRRHMIRRSVEQYVLRPTFEANEYFNSMPSLQFHPRQVALDFDPALASFFMDLRDRGEISRETLLAQIDLNEDDEARKREREQEFFDSIFKTQVPFSGNSQNFLETKAGGRNGGGNRNGGGAAPGTGQGQEPVNPTKTADNGSNRKKF